MNRSRLAALSAGAMFLVATVLVPATALAAGSGTVSISPNTVVTTTGSTFTVTVTTQADTAMSGASAAVDFDKTKLQIISVTKGAEWNAASPTWVFPSVGDIATANNTGRLKTIATYFADGTSSVPATTATTLATISFFAIAPGTPTISITGSGPDAAAIIDGSAASYGTPVATTTSAGSAVTINTGANPNDQISANVTGSVAAPRLALTCPAAVTVPLARNTDNEAQFDCNVASDGAWTLSVKDTNVDANHGKLVDASQVPTAVLANSLRIQSVESVRDLAADPGLQSVRSSAQNESVPLTFRQVVNPGDKPGAYGMSVLFSIVNTF